jgi:hypothetical protein
MIEDAPPATAEDMREALDNIDAKIVEARQLWNASDGADAVRLSDCLNRLRTSRTAIYEEAYLESINDPEFVDAINRITAAAKGLNAVASNMTSATDFITSLSGFLGVAGKAMPVLKSFIG